MAGAPKDPGDTGLSAGAVLARENTKNVFLFGILALIVGGAIAGSTWPHDTADPVYFGSGPATVTHHGSTGGWLLGLTIVGIGQLMLLAAIIAWGVRQGVTSAERYRPPVKPVGTGYSPPYAGGGEGGHRAAPQQYQDPDPG